MAKTILYGVQKLTPTTDNNFYISYDPNSRPESTNEVRYLVDTTLQVAPAPINIYLPASSSFQGILPIWIFVVDVSGTSQTRPIIIHASGGDKINGISTITLNTNNASLCVQLASQGYWFSPTTGSGVVGLVQSVSGLNTDNTDPLNPVVQIAVDGVSITGAGTPVSPLVANFPAPPPALVFGSTITGSGTALSPYNAQLLLGSGAIDGTLVVSPLGNDATAVPYDMQRHYSTIEGAVAVAKAGDLIFVYAGTYTPTTTLQKDGVYFYFCDGAIVSRAGTLFDITTENVVVLGYGEFSNTRVGLSGQAMVEGRGAGSLVFQCRKTTDLSNEATFRLGQGTFRIYVLESISSISRNFIIDSTVDLICNAQSMLITGVYPVLNISGACNLRFRSSTNFTGKCIINTDIMQSVNGNTTLMQLNCQAGGSIIINAKKMICRTTTNVSYLITLVNVNTGYIEINGDIYANGVGVKDCGIYCANFNTTSPQYLYFKGDIFVQEGYAIRTSCGTVMNYEGNIYGNPVVVVPLFGSPVPPIPALINISRDGGFNPSTSQVIINNSSLNAFNLATACVWKDMMPDGAGVLNRDNYLELNSVKLYCDPLSNGIVGTPPVAPSLNVVQMNGVVGNTLSDINITENGVPLTNNVRLLSTYPPIA